MIDENSNPHDGLVSMVLGKPWMDHAKGDTIRVDVERKKWLESHGYGMAPTAPTSERDERDKKDEKVDIKVPELTAKKESES